MSGILDVGMLGEAPPMLLALVVGGMVLFVLLAPLALEARSHAARLRRTMIERHRNKLRAASLRRTRTSQLDRSHSVARRLATLMALLPTQMKNYSHKLLRSAGYCSPGALIFFWSTKTIILLFCIVMLFFVQIFVPSETQASNELVFFVWFSPLFFFLPDLIIKRQKKVRLTRLSRSLPDGLDLLVICAEAGLSLDAALKRVADEFIGVVPELSEELLLTSVELNFLPDRRQALTNLAARVELPAVRGVVATLIQTEKYGTPLAQALRTLASEFRDHRLLTAEEKAARLPAILTVPMIIFILPALFIVLAAPAYLQVSEKFAG